jgi:hypothetical protein
MGRSGDNSSEREGSSGLPETPTGRTFELKRRSLIYDTISRKRSELKLQLETHINLKTQLKVRIERFLSKRQNGTVFSF